MQLWTFPLLKCTRLGFLHIEESQNMYANMHPEVLKYTPQTWKYALKTHPNRSSIIHFVYNLILVTLSNTLTTDRIRLLR